MLQSALIQLQMDDQITSNEQTIKEPIQSGKKMKLRKKKTPVKKKTKKKRQEAHPAESEYETASESGEEKELMTEINTEKTDAAVDERAAEASEYMKNIGVMRRYLIGKSSNVDIEPPKQGKPMKSLPSLIPGTSSAGGVQDGGSRRCSARNTKNGASSKII